ncbi:hypothetical protein BCV69DRAFT_292072 [Microstroma glucosiphilum]|uniref:Uncharacterized protein n=1 Tax=Pseudomicrostroma glucosiphilum TaxID=1684307 RepID=A0A316UM22_9BASI|nr:hypothetical protein BCV69DRAFT_292072 [Pseudomicrostroma glucosiphilum]PWN24245.1 hypothetical protein BCV69DRAFT_292072 [Pseudomicrostroma glucosiphilum]
MKVALQAVMAAVTLTLLTARSDAAPLPSFRFSEVSKYTPHVARGLPTQLLPPGFSYTGWVRSAMLNNGHGCAHGPTGCASGSKPGSNPPRPLDTAATKRAGITAPARHPPIEDCGQSPTGCNSKGDPPAPTHHTRAETGEGMPFLGGGCSHSPTGCSVALPTDPDVGTGGGTHGKKRDVTQAQDEAPVLAARGKGKGGCAHSPTGCAPGGGGNHPPHPVQGKEETNTVEEEEVQQRALAATEATLLARGKGRGSGGHIPPPSQGKVQTNVIDEDQVQERALATRGCGPPGGGGNHPPHPAQGEEQTTVIDEDQETKREVGATGMEFAARGGGGNHPIHPKVNDYQVEQRAANLDATLAPRGKGKGGCAHSPTGCGPPGGGGGHIPQPGHPADEKRDFIKQGEELLTTLVATPTRGKSGRSCGHSPTGCPRPPPPPGNGGPNPGHACCAK